MSPEQIEEMYDRIELDLVLVTEWIEGAGEPADLLMLLEIQQVARDGIDQAARGLLDRFSGAEIGRAIGVSRQAVHNRWVSR